MVKNILIGGVTDNEVIISGKVPYDPPSEVNNPKVYSLTFDQSTIKFYVNGELIDSVSNTGNCKYLDNIFLVQIMTILNILKESCLQLHFMIKHCQTMREFL